MSELGNVDTKISGLPDERHEAVRTAYHSSALEMRKRELAELVPAKLTAEQLGQARSVENASREYLVKKLLRLGLPDNSLRDLPEVHYVKKPKTPKKERQKETHGDFNHVTNIASVYMDEADFFSNLTIIPHELSHASVGIEVNMIFPDDETGELGGATVLGLGFMDDKGRAQGDLVEEGMVIFDQVDFSTTHLNQMFPEEYQRRRSQVDQQNRRGRFHKIDTSLYGQVDLDTMMPFTNFNAPNLPLIRKFPLPDLVGSKMLKEYLFTRKLCELVGQNANPEASDPEEAVSAGRDILDRDRYLRTGKAREAIVATLGEERATKIFQFKAHDDKIDDAMRILVAA